MQEEATDRQTLGGLAREFAGELILVLSQHARPQGEQRDMLVARAGRSVVCGFLSALVVYTGLMFLLWAGVAAICAALVREGWSTASAVCVAFLAMGLFWTIAGSVATWFVVRRLSDMPLRREAGPPSSVPWETSHAGGRAM